MATHYRALWSDRDAGLVERVHEVFCSWVAEKSNGELGPSPAEQENADATMRVRLERETEPVVESDGPGTVTSVFRGVLVESRDDDSRWTTTVRAWAGPAVTHDPGGRHGWIWVDVDAVSYQSLDDVTVAAPKFVRALLAGGEAPMRSDVLLSERARSFDGAEGAEELAAIVTSMERDVPVVVFTPLPPDFSRDPSALQSDRRRFENALVRAAHMSAAMALVARLDETGVDSFNQIMGESYAVHDGAFRLYLPGADPALDDEAWRHRYTPASRLMRQSDTAGRQINRAVALRASARRAPASYEHAERLLNSAARREPDDLGELIAIAEKESADLRITVADLDQRYIDALDEQYQLEQENNRLRADLREARAKITLAEATLWRDQPAEMEQLANGRFPFSADSPTDAVLLAHEHLKGPLCFPLENCKDLDDLDNAVEAKAWGETSWRAFRALHAYAEELGAGREPGGFWQWCQRSGHPFAWPATPKKLAMRESKTVSNSDRLRKKREFIIDRRIEPSGRLYMGAHIKIATGGGPLAPRIYFHPSAETGTVHIGYYGPHRNVPNTLT